MPTDLVLREQMTRACLQRDLNRGLRFDASTWFDDMGSQSYANNRDLEDLLRRLNNSRDHDGLRPLRLSEVARAVLYPEPSSRITIKFDNQ